MLLANSKGSQPSLPLQKRFCLAREEFFSENDCSECGLILNIYSRISLKGEFEILQKRHTLSQHSREKISNSGLII